MRSFRRQLSNIWKEGEEQWNCGTCTNNAKCQEHSLDSWSSTIYIGIYVTSTPNDDSESLENL